MWDFQTYWFDVSMVSMMFAVGNILMGHFEEHTPKWRRVLKYFLSLVVVIGLVHFTNRYIAYGFVGCFALFALYVHAIVLPKKGINGWTGEPKDEYYKFRGWNNSSQ